MKYLFLSLLLLFGLECLPQVGIMFTNAQEVDDNRYKGYDGTPYQFKEWKTVNIYDPSGLAFERMRFNFNGFTNEIEIRHNEKFVELDQMAYTKIETIEEESLLFKRGVNGHFQEKFVEVLYEGPKRQLVRKFRCEVTEKEFNDVGKTILIKRFDPKFTYFFIKDGKIEEVRLKKKNLYTYFGYKKKVEDFLNNNNFKITNPKHLAALVKYLEEEGL